MHRSVLLILLLSMAFSTACGGQEASNPPEERPEDKPPETTSEPTQAPPRNAEEAAADAAKKRAAEQGITAGYQVVSVTDGTTAYQGPQGAADVYAGAPTEAGMQDLTKRLLDEHPEYDVMTASFYRAGEPMSTSSLIGVRYAFDSPAVEQKFYSDLEGSMDDMIREQCANWTPEDYETLGPPPPEWNCEQYQ